MICFAKLHFFPLPPTIPNPMKHTLSNLFFGFIRMCLPVLFFDGLKNAFDVDFLGFDNAYGEILFLVFVIFTSSFYTDFQQFFEQFHRLFFFKFINAQRDVEDAFICKRFDVSFKAMLCHYAICIFPVFGIASDYLVQVTASLDKGAQTCKFFFHFGIAFPFAGYVVPILAIG